MRERDGGEDQQAAARHASRGGDGKAAAFGATAELLLPARSLLILSGDARYGWAHGIHARRTDVLDGTLLRRKTRASLTFRKVLPAPAVDTAMANLAAHERDA